jgi:hypothetical protein
MDKKRGKRKKTDLIAFKEEREKRERKRKQKERKNVMIRRGSK